MTVFEYFIAAGSAKESSSTSIHTYNQIYNLNLPPNTPILICNSGYVIQHKCPNHIKTFPCGILCEPQYNIVWTENLSKTLNQNTFWVEPIYEENALLFSPNECFKNKDILINLSKLKNPNLPVQLQNYFML